MLYRLRTSYPWRGLVDTFGTWNSIYKQFVENGFTPEAVPSNGAPLRQAQTTLSQYGSHGFHDAMATHLKRQQRP